MRQVRSLVLLLFLTVGLCVSAAASATARNSVVVASKNFPENRLLGEMFAQLIEARTDLDVERRLGLAGTQVCFEAVCTGAADVYPEYTGTGWVSILGEEPGAPGKAGSAVETLRSVRREFLRRYELVWLAPLGFENAYEIAVPRALAEEHGLRSISDLAAIAPELRAAFGYEFNERPDGLPGLRETYGLRFASVIGMQQALKYQAAGDGEIDVLDVYTTDGRLLVHDLVVLDDDRGFFPPYQAAPLVSGAALQRHPEIAVVLSLLADTLDEETLRALNRRLQVDGDSEANVARDALRDLGLVDTASDTAPSNSGTTGRAGFWRFLWQERAALGQRTLEHVGLCAAALLLGAALAIPLGLWLERRRGWAESVIRAVGITQTVPSIALLAFMIPLFGIGTLPALVALWIYSLFPILRNTYSGVRDANPRAVEAATALGMTGGQVLRQVRLPLAAPVILAGVRTAAVLTVGTATLAAFIGAGGLGEPIVTGLQLVDERRILAGALPAALLALAVDGLLALLERTLRPRGLEVAPQGTTQAS